MRMVLFGETEAIGEALGAPAARNALARLAAGKPVPDDPSFTPARRLGLLRTRADGSVALGPVVKVAPRIRREVLSEASDTAVGLIRRRIPDLAAALGGMTPSDARWRASSLLVVGGLLLDLSVGEQLRGAGLIDRPEEGTGVWLLPDCEGVAVGMRWDHGSGVGVCVMWAEPGPPTPDLPDPRDLAMVLRDRAGRPEWAAAALRLRFGGWWPDGESSSVLRLRPGAPLWSALDDVARSIVRDAHAGLIASLADQDADSARMASRLLMEDVLTRLHAEGAVSVAAPLRQRIVWEGPNRLAEGRVPAGGAR